MVQKANYAVKMYENVGLKIAIEPAHFSGVGSIFMGRAKSEERQFKFIDLTETIFPTE